MRRLLLQCRQQFLRTGWWWNFVFERDIAGRHLFAIKLLVGTVVWTQRGSFQGNPGKRTARSRVTQNLRSHRCIRGGRSIAPFGTGGGGGIGAQFHLAVEDPLRAAVVHQQQHKVRRLTSDLQTKAAPFECHHRRRAPFSVEFFATTAGHHSPPIVGSNNKRSFHDRRQNDDTRSLIEKVLGNVFWNVQYFAERLAGGFHAVHFCLVVGGFQGVHEEQR